MSRTDWEEGRAMIRLATARVRISLVIAAIAVTVPMITFAQTNEPAIESVPTEAEAGEVTASPTGDGTSVETDLPARSAIPAKVEVEIQRRFNDLRRELLDDRTKLVDWWLAATAIFLTLLGIVAVIAGYLSFKRFREIETEARNSVEAAKQHETTAKHLRELIEEHLIESEERVQRIRGLTAEAAANDPAKANLTVEDVRGNPKASLTDKAIANALDLQQQGRDKEALEKWRAIAGIAEGADNNLAAHAWFSVGYLLQDEHPEGGISAYDEAIRLNPHYAVAYYNRGVSKAALNRYENAIADYDEAIRLNPGLAEAYTNRGSAKQELGQHDAAITDYGEAIRQNPNYAAAYYNRGNSRAALNRYENAIGDHDEAIRINPGLAEAYTSRGNSKAALSRYENAIADHDQAIRLKPDYAEAYSNRGAAKAELRRHEDAIADYNQAILLKPDFAEAYSNRGNSKAALNQYENAIADHDEAIRLNPGLAKAYGNRGNAKNALGRHEDAIADHNEAIRLNPDLDGAYFNRGNSKAALNRYENAIADYNQAILLNPCLAEVYSNRGTAKDELRRYEDAIADYDEAIRLNPSLAEAYFNRGAAKAALALKGEARKDIKTALKFARNANDAKIVTQAEQALRDLNDAEDS